MDETCEVHMNSSKIENESLNRHLQIQRLQMYSPIAETTIIFNVSLNLRYCMIDATFNLKRILNEIKTYRATKCMKCIIFALLLLFGSI